jgi:hypothetical protein
MLRDKSFIKPAVVSVLAMVGGKTFLSSWAVPCGRVGLGGDGKNISGDERP